jgi:hypothetical protein
LVSFLANSRHFVTSLASSWSASVTRDI